MAQRLPSVEQVVRVLSQYNGRDKAIRCAYFSLIILSTKVADPELAKRLFALAKELSKCRLIFRQLNIPSLFSAAAKVPDELSRTTDTVDSSLSSGVTIIYAIQNVVELCAWLSDSKLLNLETSLWFRTALYLWILAMFHGLLRLGIKLRQADFRRRRGELSEQAYADVTRNDRIALLGLAADFIAGISSLPHKFLWAGMLTQRQSAVFSLVASVVGLYRCF